MASIRAHECAALFARIDALEKEYIDFWIDVCKIESPTDFKEGVDSVGRYFIEKAKERDWKVEVSQQPISGDCVCITLNSEVKARPIVFSGHMDTVHPVGFFGEDVVTWDEEKIYGPGVTDCKGGAVAGFYAMAALEDQGFKERPVKLILQSDEEVSSRTSNKETINFMAKMAEDCVAFLNCEPHTKGAAVVSRKGISKYEFEVQGKAAHASLCYEGASAIREAACKIVELENMKNPRGLTCNCGLIYGGIAQNTVPDKCVFTADIRFSNDQEMLEADKLVAEIADRTFIEGTSCKVTLKSRRCAMEKTGRNMDLLEEINMIYKEVGLAPLVAIHNNPGSDAADMTHYGLPCLDSFGVEGGSIHSRDEYAYLASLRVAAKNLAAVAWCI